uniref:Uncharacterized protein n=1 Tax=Ditylenchus dipsaci TaxID=166011 RepID=A0A915DYS3_9BILA
MSKKEKELCKQGIPIIRLCHKCYRCLRNESNPEKVEETKKDLQNEVSGSETLQEQNEEVRQEDKSISQKEGGHRIKFTKSHSSASSSSSDDIKEKTVKSPEAKSKSISPDSQQSDGSWLAGSSQQGSKYQTSNVNRLIKKSLSSPSSGHISFGSAKGSAFAAMMDKVKDSNMLKQPILMLNSNVCKIQTQLSFLDEKVTEVTEGLASLSSRLDVFLGRDKDSISTKFEHVCCELMENELERKFEHGRDFICDFENSCGNEELDLCSFDTSKNPAYVLIECTLALMSLDKLNKCVRKRKAIANQFKIPIQSIRAYIMCMRIDPVKEQDLREHARDKDIIIRIAGLKEEYSSSNAC